MFCCRKKKKMKRFLVVLNLYRKLYDIFSKIYSDFCYVAIVVIPFYKKAIKNRKPKCCFAITSACVHITCCHSTFQFGLIRSVRTLSTFMPSFASSSYFLSTKYVEQNDSLQTNHGENVFASFLFSRARVKLIDMREYCALRKYIYIFFIEKLSDFIDNML